MRAERTDEEGSGGGRETRDAALEYRGHRKCPSGINKAQSWIMVPTQLGVLAHGREGRGRGEEDGERGGGWRKGRVKMGRAVSVIAE